MAVEKLYYCGGPDDAIRKVTEVPPSKELEQYLSSRLQAGKTPLKDVGMIWHNGVRLFQVDTVGMLIQGFVTYNDMIDVHIVFWDRRLRGREPMCRSMAQLVASEGGFAGVWTAIPQDAAATLAFAKRVGFRQERTVNGIAVLTLVT